MEVTAQVQGDEIENGEPEPLTTGSQAYVPDLSVNCGPGMLLSIVVFDKPFTLL